MRRKIKVECEEDLGKLGETEKQEFLHDTKITNINPAAKNIYINIPSKWHPILGLKKVGVKTIKLLQKKVMMEYCGKNEYGWPEIRIMFVDDEDEVAKE